MRTLVVFLSAALALGCKDKPKAQPPTVGSAAAASQDAQSEAPIKEAPPGKPGSKVLVLPKGDGSPPVKTTKPLTLAQAERLSQLEFPGFKKPTVKRAADKVLEVKYKTENRPFIVTTIDIGPCFDCVPMDLAKWKPKEDSLKVLVPPDLRDRPDTLWDFGVTELHKQPLVFTYQLGWHFGKDENDNPIGQYSHAYAIYFNDGMNQIRVVASFADDPPNSRDAMVALAPREDLEKFAKSFLDVYTHEWAK